MSTTGRSSYRSSRRSVCRPWTKKRRSISTWFQKRLARPSPAPVVFALLTLLCLIAYGLSTPYMQPEQRVSLRVPAVPLFVSIYHAPITVIATGTTAYPATEAHGVLTITNGSIIAQQLPRGLILTASSGAEVTTDQAVFVPAGDANGYGYATVAAHALVGGSQGNIAAYGVDSVVGTSIYIRNTRPFRGGRNAYSTPFATQQDRLRAIAQARATLNQEAAGLHYPCAETITSAVLTWHCQFITFRVPSYLRVVSVRIQGTSLVLEVVFVAPPRRAWAK